MRRVHETVGLLSLVLCTTVAGADWRQFRGPGGLGVSVEKGLPLEWSATKNVVWKTPLPGAGGSSPIVTGNRVFVTCYSGYGLDAKNPGKMEDLRRHLLCVDRGSGKVLWQKEFEPLLPEHNYKGEGSYHGYAASTPTTDGERLYVFFGKSGVYCFDLDGKQLWHVSVGEKVNSQWGSGASPMLYKDKLIVNACIESGAVVALDKLTGKELWKGPKISQAWGTPVLVLGKEPELVISAQDRVVSVDPETGKELWHAEGVHRYVCPSVVAHDGVVYVIGGGSTSLAIKTGGRGDVTKTHTLWRLNKGSNVGSPIYLDGHLYWAQENGGVLYCQDAKTGKVIYQERLKSASGKIFGSPVLADGKLYYPTQDNGVVVVAAEPTFKLLAHNIFDDDKNRANASPAVSDGQIFWRTDRNLYCIGKK